jgi:DNA-binding GntR family transcriptional regulator
VIERKIIRALNDYAEKDWQIAQHAGFTVRVVRHNLQKLVARGLVSRKPCGGYQVQYG